MACTSVWKTNNLAVELTYTTICVLFVVQAIYAKVKRASIAFQFDSAMAIGCAIPIGIWLN